MDDALRLTSLQQALCNAENGVYFAPIRHHSPACAWAIRQLIRDIKPRQILIEAPEDLQSHIKLLVDKGTVPPVALAVLVDRKRQSRVSAYYPFCSHSPEYVALLEGHALSKSLKSKIGFIDLPATDKVMLNESTATQSVVTDTEDYFDSGNFIAEMCRQSGCRNGHELWDHWFESRLGQADWKAFFADVGAYCAALRDATPETTIERNGDNARERHMAKAIVAALKKDGPIVVITGGFHTPALIDRVFDDKKSGMPKALSAIKSKASMTSESEEQSLTLENKRVTNAQSKIESSSYLIRYGFQALDALNGYSAGLPQPGYYDYLWKRAADADGAPQWRETALDLLSLFTHKMREDGHDLSVPLQVEALRVAEGLALMRGREGAGRYDLIDAVRTALVKGEVGFNEVWTERLLEFLRGDQIGDVPASAGSPPIVEDARSRAKRLRIDVSDGSRRKRRLDIRRKPAHLDASKFLHAMTLLETSFAERQSGPDFVHGGNSARLFEEWSYAWSPVVEGRLTELATYGDSIVTAGVTLLHQRAADMRSAGHSRDIEALADLLVQGILAGYADELGRFLDALSNDIQAHGDFYAIAKTLRRLHHIGNTTGPLGIAANLDLHTVTQAAYRRLVYLCDDLPKTVEEEVPRSLEALKIMTELLRAPDGNQFDRSLFDEAISRIADAQPPPELLGSVLAIAVIGNLRDSRDICNALAGSFNGTVENEQDRVGVLRGLLFTTPEIIWRREDVLKAIDTLLCELPEQEFIELLPHFRLAFTALNPREADRVADSLARYHGGRGAEFIEHQSALTEGDLQRGLALQKQLTESLLADGLGKWLETEDE